MAEMAIFVYPDLLWLQIGLADRQSHPFWVESFGRRYQAGTSRPFGILVRQSQDSLARYKVVEYQNACATRIVVIPPGELQFRFPLPIAGTLSTSVELRPIATIPSWDQFQREKIELTKPASTGRGLALVYPQ